MRLAKKQIANGAVLSDMPVLLHCSFVLAGMLQALQLNAIINSGTAFR